MKSCPQCGKAYPDSENFCEIDGTALASGQPTGAQTTTEAPLAAGAAIECPACGGKAEPGEAICNFCGTRLQPEAAREQTVQPRVRLRQTAPVEGRFEGEPPPELTERSETRRVLGIAGYTIAAVVALTAGAWLALHLSSRPAKEATKGAAPGAVASPVPSGPMVALANSIGLQVTGESASAPERDQAAARKVFDANSAGLLDTYKRALATDASAHDGIALRLRVTPDGKVVAGSVRVSTSPNPSLDAEAVNKTMGWRFAPFSGTEVEVDYPIVFARDGSERAQIESQLADKLAHLTPTEPPEYASAPPPSPIATPPAVAIATPPAPAPTPEVAAATSRPRPRRAKHTKLASLPSPKPTLLDRVRKELATAKQFSRVKAYTDHGTVTLFGKVFDNKAKLAAERLVRNVDGVTNVIDTLTTDESEWADRENRIRQALQNAGLSKVDVKVIGHDAYLSGEVSTEQEKQRAVTVAVTAADVSVASNIIRVVPRGLFGF
jgi:BON domain